MNDPSDLFGRDGHATMLTLDRYDLGELDERQERHIESHVQLCVHCRARLSAVVEPVGALTAPRAARGVPTVTRGIATMAGAAMAASLVALLGSTMWPTPRLMEEGPAEPTAVASAYTSVAPECLDVEPPGLEVVSRGDRISARTEAHNTIAVVVVNEWEGDGDTGGVEAGVVDILLAPQPVEGRVDVALPAKWAGHRVVVLACPDLPQLELGDIVDVEPSCSMHDHYIAHRDADARDS